MVIAEWKLPALYLGWGLPAPKDVDPEGNNTGLGKGGTGNIVPEEDAAVEGGPRVGRNRCLFMGLLEAR